MSAPGQNLPFSQPFSATALPPIADENRGIWGKTVVPDDCGQSTRMRPTSQICLKTVQEGMILFGPLRSQVART